MSFNDVVAYWKKQGKLHLDASKVSFPIKSVEDYQTPKRVLPGMYVYADGLIYPEIIKGRQIKAVVGYVKGSEVLAVCLQEVTRQWSSDWLEAKETREMTRGQEATRKILKIAHQKWQKAEAAQWCYDYTEDGVRLGEAFLPSLTELEKLCANKEAINVSLRTLGAGFYGWYWSSTEYNDYNVWVLAMRDGERCAVPKDYIGRDVRPVIRIKL